ncbi:hypothetical protein DFH27DRAFT_534477 [Peziza echinospora]|nr:hypothetical protein DFH27DRAFT_534477 [Peziza echinospora]
MEAFMIMIVFFRAVDVGYCNWCMGVPVMDYDWWRVWDLGDSYGIWDLGYLSLYIYIMDISIGHGMDAIHMEKI